MKAALVAANRKTRPPPAAGLETALLDRLTLSERASTSHGRGRQQVIRWPIRSARMTDIKYRRPASGSARSQVPLGVIGIIYETRPNVTADAAACA